MSRKGNWMLKEKEKMEVLKNQKLTNVEKIQTIMNLESKTICQNDLREPFYRKVSNFKLSNKEITILNIYSIDVENKIIEFKFDVETILTPILPDEFKNEFYNELDTKTVIANVHSDYLERLNNFKNNFEIINDFNILEVIDKDIKKISKDARREVLNKAKENR